MKFTLEIDLTHYMLEDGKVNYTALGEDISCVANRVDNGYDEGTLTPPKEVVVGAWSIK